MKRLCLLLAIILCLLPMLSCDNKQKSDVAPYASIDILKVGKADCIVINTGTKIIMIDTAEEGNLPDIRSYMQKKGYNKIDMLILTHFDKDHIGGASGVISEYEVGTVIESFFFCDSEEYLSYHSQIDKAGCNIKRLTSDYSFESDGCELTIDVPKSNRYEEKQDNNASLVVSLKCGDKRFLFCGDAMELRLDELLSAKCGKYDFVKLPYHGNYLENYAEFLDETQPLYGAITCSKKNPVSEDTLSLLYERDIEVYQTRYGQINITSDGSKIEINQDTN